MKKKIAIITLPLRNYNYGGILQNYALQQYLLQNFDVEVETIDFQFSSPESWARKLKIFLHHQVYAGYYRFRKKVNQALEKFILSKINLSPTLRSKSEIGTYVKNKNFDVLIAGSDQIWRFEYAGLDKYQLMYLNIDTPKNTRKISYAASFGVNEWTLPAKTNEIRNYLQDFDALSVRENSAVDILESVFDMKSEHLIDPTLLLKKEDYLKLLPESLTTVEPSKKTLYAYILDMDEGKRQMLERVSRELGTDLKIIELEREKFKDINNHNYTSFKGLEAQSVEQWLGSFYHADYIITDSFHGTVFSILFKKPFIALGNTGRGMSRFKSLLNGLELSERLCTEMDENKILNILTTSSDYHQVELHLKKEREKAHDFLTRNIMN